MGMKLTSLRRFARRAFPTVGPQTNVMLVPDHFLSYRVPISERVSPRPGSFAKTVDIRLGKFVVAKRGRRRLFILGYNKDIDTLLSYPTVKCGFLVGGIFGNHWQALPDETIVVA